MSTPGETEQQRAPLTASDDTLEWQSELDATMAEIDSRLRHPRRRASDTAAPPTAPQLGKVVITSELLDEIAWRVAEQLRRAQANGAPTAKTPAAPRKTATAPPPEPEQIPTGIAVTIRIRKPLFSFWRRRTRRETLISFADYRIT